MFFSYTTKFIYEHTYSYTIGRWRGVAKKYIFGTYVRRVNMIQRAFNRSMSGASNALSPKCFRPFFAFLHQLKVKSF